MNEHQQKLWKSMIDLIETYLSGETKDFYGIVGKLEGALDASEIRDVDLIKQWYDFWTPLEARRAVEGNNINETRARDELKTMQQFLLSKL